MTGASLPWHRFLWKTSSSHLNLPLRRLYTTRATNESPAKRGEDAEETTLFGAPLRRPWRARLCELERGKRAVMCRLLPDCRRLLVLRGLRRALGLDLWVRFKGYHDRKCEEPLTKLRRFARKADATGHINSRRSDRSGASESSRSFGPLRQLSAKGRECALFAALLGRVVIARRSWVGR